MELSTKADRTATSLKITDDVRREVFHLKGLISLQRGTLFVYSRTLWGSTYLAVYGTPLGNKSQSPEIDWLGTEKKIFYSVLCYESGRAALDLSKHIRGVCFLGMTKRYQKNSRLNISRTWNFWNQSRELCPKKKSDSCNFFFISLALCFKAVCRHSFLR